MDVCQNLIFFPSLFARMLLHPSRALMRMMHTQILAFSACFMPEADSRQTVCVCVCVCVCVWEARKVGRQEHRSNAGMNL